MFSVTVATVFHTVSFLFSAEDPDPAADRLILFSLLFDRAGGAGTLIDANCKVSGSPFF